MPTRTLFAWLAVAAVAVGGLVWGIPRAFPLLPTGWDVHQREAEIIGLEAIRDLGELPEDAYVVTKVELNLLVERILQESWGEVSAEAVRSSPWLRGRIGWRVRVWPGGAAPGDWTHTAMVSPEGEVLWLRLSLPKGEEPAAPTLPLAEARRRAGQLLREWGIDGAALGEPELRKQVEGERVDLTLRYPARERLFGEAVEYGVEVLFLGDRLAGFQPWLETPDERALVGVFQEQFFLGAGQIIVFFVLLPVVAVVFVRKYHHGELGVQRGAQLLILVLVTGIIGVALGAKALSQGTQAGFLPRQQTTWLVMVFLIAFNLLPAALVALVSWSVGESLARQRWGRKLAAFDALWRGAWNNATVAASALRGMVCGIALLALLVLVALPLREAGYPAMTVGMEGWNFNTAWPGVFQLAWLLAFTLPGLLAGCLLFPIALERRFGLGRSTLIGALVGWAVIMPPFLPLPLAGGFPLWLVAAAVPVALFYFTDLLTALLCGLVAKALFDTLPLLLADDGWLQLQGTLPLVVLSLPLLLSLRHLQSRERFAYRYDDVPPHVRRIAERERHRVELETARQIQSSILPELPPQLCGIELAHAYLPATEVGGDFYDVLALDDGRLALAVGDVAGHGVSSGLVMSMVKSALAVQVTFDPDVEAVFTTLNRMVYQSARRRLLATLSFALLDPAERLLTYASAGHLFPYRVSAQGSVYELEAGEYPLGVRPTIRPQVRRERLEAGDYVVLLSDGVVEATPEGSDEPFGFERVERSLQRHAGGSPQELVRGLLQDLEDFSGSRPRQDDVTVLAVRLPSSH